MQNEKLDCDIISYCQRLLSSTYKDVQSLQDTRLVPVRKDGSWVYALKFKPAQGFCGQIHHNGNDHWVTSVCPEPSRILVYDSCISKRETITDSLKIQLSQLYWTNNNKEQAIEITIPRVQQQTNCADCGVFAVAYLTEYCHTGRELFFLELFVKGREKLR